MRASLREWREMREFEALDRSFHDIVFYSVGAGHWPHLGPVIESLVRDHNRNVSYLTSDPSDPGLRVDDERIRAFLIGSGSVRTIVFRGIDCRHFIMTLPDLESFHLKRSVHRVHYVYLFHSMNSTHTAYRKGAFDAYDTLLCVGPHHVEEIRRNEAVYGLKAKELVEHGSAKLDTMIAQFNDCAASATPDRIREVLVAPSWGQCSLIEHPVGCELIETVIGGGYRVVLRPHPMTVRRMPELVLKLKQKYRDERRFVVEEDMNATESWLRSDVMVSDWSGAAAEYSFSMQKPVIYVDTPQKINNPEWQKIGVRPFEDRIRCEIGHVVDPSAVATVPSLIEDCLRNAELMRERILRARASQVFNVGRSSQVAADYLASLVRES